MLVSLRDSQVLKHLSFTFDPFTLLLSYARFFKTNNKIS